MTNRSIIVLFCIVLSGCSGQNKKINGISFVGAREAAVQANVDPVIQLNANYAAVMPIGFLRATDDPNLVYDTDRQWYGETTKGAQQYIELLKQNNIAVMLKPQIWVWRGEYTGFIKMKSDAEWKELEGRYRDYILEYARLAEQTGAAIFCIGTELEQFIVARTDYWKQLIGEIRSIYSGKLTYAANWDEYKRFPLWDQLDYIGIDAYFPVSESQTPTMAEARRGWQAWKPEIRQLSEELGKEVLFAEFGYRSVDYAGKTPWNSDRSLNEVNLEAQSQMTEALFAEFWDEDWFAGGFVWKWFIDYERSGGSSNSRFTPQNKPAEAVIRKQYSRDQ